MARPFAGSGIVFGAIALLGCNGPAAPTPLGPPTVSPSPGGSGPTSSFPLSGTYDLTLSLGDECTAVPAAERTRSYTATIAYAAAGRYVVTLGSGAFLNGTICTGGEGVMAGMGCDQFFASEDTDTVNFFLENGEDAHGGHIVERLPSGGWLEVVGRASGPFSLASSAATGTANAWYCPVGGSYPFPCTGFVSCQAAGLRMTLARR